VIPGIGSISVGDPQNGEPEGWQWVRLTDIARLESGHTPSRKHPEYWGGDIPWVSLPDARRHHGCVLQDTTQKTNERGIANSAARVLPADTVCLSRTASVGHVFRLGRPMATSQDFVNWVCSKALEPRFLMYALMAEGNHIRNFGKGTTHTTIYFPEVLAFHLCLAPIAEQHRIVAKVETLLKRVSVVRDRLGKVPNILQRFRHAVLVGGCSGTLTSDWRDAQSALMDPSELRRRLLDDRRRAWHRSEIERLEARGRRVDQQQLCLRYREPLSATSTFDVPEGWTWASLDELTLFAGGITKGQKRAAGTRTRRIPYLRVANVQRGRLDLAEVKEIEATEEEIRELRLEPGDILLNEGGDIDKLGRGWIWNGEIEECIHQNHVFRARPASELIDSRFVSYYANSIGQEFFFEAGAQTVNLASVSMTKVKSLPVPIPPIAEQREIVHRVSRLLAFADAIEGRVASAVARAERLTQSILRKAVKGELVLTEAELARKEGRAYEPASALLERVRARPTQVERRDRRGAPRPRRNRASRSTRVSA
jgi:type I restriction enzyme S subunit